MTDKNTIDLRFVSALLPHGYIHVNMNKHDRKDSFQITSSLHMKVYRIGYKNTPRTYRAFFYPIVDGVVKTDFSITTAETEVEFKGIDSDVEEVARILDYIGLDYKNCTMDSNFCDAAQAFVEEFVDKYQTHRAQ
jgi:hypothetical protein